MLEATPPAPRVQLGVQGEQGVMVRALQDSQAQPDALETTPRASLAPQAQPAVLEATPRVSLVSLVPQAQRGQQGVQETPGQQVQ